MEQYTKQTVRFRAPKASLAKLLGEIIVTEPYLKTLRKHNREFRSGYGLRKYGIFRRHFMANTDRPVGSISFDRVVRQPDWLYRGPLDSDTSDRLRVLGIEDWRAWRVAHWGCRVECNPLTSRIRWTGDRCLEVSIETPNNIAKGFWDAVARIALDLDIYMEGEFANRDLRLSRGRIVQEADGGLRFEYSRDRELYREVWGN